MILRLTILILLAFSISGCLKIDDDSVKSNEKKSQNFQILEKSSSINVDSIEETQKDFDKFVDTLKPVKLIQKNEKMLKATMRLAHTNALRKAIDLYISQQSPNKYLEAFGASASEPNFNLEGENTSDCEIYSFSKLFDENYLSGKFIVININDKKIDGVDLDIMFQHKQDRIFRIWMFYIEKEDRFVVRAVTIPKNFDEKTIKYFRKLYAIYLNDDSFGV